MSTEDNQPRDGETTTDNSRPAGESGAATAAAPAGETTNPQPGDQQPAAPSTSARPASASGQGAAQHADDDHDEARGGGFDFGAILDQ